MVVCSAEHEDSFFGGGFDGGFEVGYVSGILWGALDGPGHGDYVDFFVDCCSNGLGRWLVGEVWRIWGGERYSCCASSGDLALHVLAHVLV